eukprot:m.109057 g.109057  ORF g.109057 m.109057 type:complete len:70 (+) comp12833_c0_seq4:52-261(+)
MHRELRGYRRAGPFPFVRLLLADVPSELAASEAPPLGSFFTRATAALNRFRFMVPICPGSTAKKSVTGG